MAGSGSSDAAEKKPWMNKRDILWYLVFFGFAINYMIRINLNIAIVSMVRPRPKNNISLSSECIAEEVAHNLSFSHNASILEHARFDWDEHQQGLILGSFYWLHWMTQIPGGILARTYGTKMIFGLSNLFGVLICFITPAASNWGYGYLIVLRILQGFITGFSWPAMHDMTAKWIPPNERSKFVTAYLGSSIGAGLTFPMCGYIISYWGWELVFHVCGIIGCIWYGAWYVLVFDSPAEHPRISKTEKDYITKSLGRSISTEKSPTPWKSILTSVPVWLNVFAQWGGIWGLYASMTYAPTYFKMIHGWNIQATGFLSGLPHFLRVCWAFIFSQIGDYMLRNRKMTRTNVRKLATLFACIIHGLCMWAMANSGCNYAAAIVFLTAATASHGAVSTGSLASFVDLSPNYASIQLGLSGMISVLPGFIAPVIVGYLTFNNQTIGQWQKVFEIAAVMLITPGILYLLFAKSDLQPWNSPQSNNEAILESELKVLKQDTEDLEKPTTIKADK